MRPVLRYHGGKWALAPWIISHFPPHRVYVEPFGGAASVLLRKPRCYAEVYNDVDGEVVNLFRVLRDPTTAARLASALTLTPFSRDEFSLSYEPSADPLESARRLVVRSFMGFGSNACNAERPTGFRSNSNRSGTTPAHDWSQYPEVLRYAVQRLRGVVIENKDAFSVIAQHDSPDTLFYVDPPYLAETRGRNQFGNYRHEMNQEAHEKLSALLRAVKGMVIVSGYDSELYRDLYAGWSSVTRAAHADGAKDRVEVLWMNPLCHPAQTMLEVA